YLRRAGLLVPRPDGPARNAQASSELGVSHARLPCLPRDGADQPGRLPAQIAGCLAAHARLLGHQRGRSATAGFFHIRDRNIRKGDAMKILVYSAMNAETVFNNFGEPEYSYYFVLREFLPLLRQFGEVQQVEDPATEVDPIYEAALRQGQDCVFLSFSPPHLTCLGLACPTIPVFAWEFSSMPCEAWWDDRPEHDWGWCLRQCAGAIVHSEQSASVVRQLMGEDYPVTAIPAPLW